MKKILIALFLAAVILIGCQSKPVVDVYLYDGNVLTGQLQEANFDSGEIIVRDSKSGEVVVVNTSQIKKIEVK